MRRNKRLFAFSVLAVIGLGWLLWKLSPAPAARYAFELTAIVESDMIGFQTAVGCYPSEAEFMGKTRTVYGLREKVFSRRLKSGKMFYIAVPNACSYVRTASGGYLSKGDWERPSLEKSRAVLPLTYMTDGSREPETIRFFTSSQGAAPDQPTIMLSTIEQLDETNSNMGEQIGNRDPLVRAGGWISVVFLPIFNAPKLEERWIEDRWQAGACEIARLNEQGRTAVGTFDPSGRLLKLFWPRLWDGVPLSDITLPVHLKDDTKAAAIREALDLVIPAVPTAEGFEIRPDQPGTVEMFHANSERHRMSRRASAYFFNGIQLSKEGEQDSLPFVIQCAAEHRLYIPEHLVFLRMKPI